MNGKTKKTKNQGTVSISIANVFSQEEIAEKVAEINSNLRSYTWRQLETKGKFDKNDKLSFISDIPHELQLLRHNAADLIIYHPVLTPS